MPSQTPPVVGIVLFAAASGPAYVCERERLSHDETVHNRNNTQVPMQIKLDDIYSGTSDKGPSEIGTTS